jgi:polysaccharide biosynthesis/export protein
MTGNLHDRLALRTSSLRWRPSALLLAACMTAAPSFSAQAQADAQPATSAIPLTIGVGDHVNVTVFDTPSLSFSDRIDEAGSVKAPVLGSVRLTGLTTDGAARMIEKDLRDGDIMSHPSVTVEDTELATQGIVLLGQVHSPGTYTMPGPHTLYDALSSAGGPSETQGSKITITHRNDSAHPLEIAVNSPNFSEVQRSTPVYPGDTIFVSKADVMYVTGDVGHSGAFYIQNGRQLNVLDAIALAGGNTFTAKEGSVSILRQTPQGAIRIPLDLQRIKKNTAPNVALQADDVLIIPHSTLKVFLQSVLPSLATTSSSVALSAAVVR